MDLISVVLMLVVVGVVLYLISLIPMDGTIKQIINVVVIIAVILWLLGLFTGYLPHIHVGR